MPACLPEFPQELVGKTVLVASESLGPVNGVSRTTLTLIDYLRANGVVVATCSPKYAGQCLTAAGPDADKQPIINRDWVGAIQAKSSSLGSRALGGGWSLHNRRKDIAAEGKLPPQPKALTQGPPMLNRSRSEDNRRRSHASKLSHHHPDFRLDGWPLPYNPDLTVAYPFRLGVVYAKTFKPDLIYLASPASVGFQFLLQLRQLDKPTPTLLNFQTDLSHYSKTLFIPPLDRYGMWLLKIVQGYLFNAPAVQTIFYPSDPCRDYMVSCGAPEGKMVKNGRGVDTELFNPVCRDKAYRKEIAPNGEIIFCCISRIAPEKGFEFLAKAAEKLAESGLAFKLLIVGGNKNPTVEKEVRSYFRKVSDKVVFAGMLRGTSLARAYASADVFLHCSISETFGLVVLESMASGVPVVARNEGGPGETVKHGISGYLCPPQDLDQFVSYARQLATDHTLRAEMISNARQQALDTTWDNINHNVALQLAKALNTSTPCDAQKAQGGFHGTWSGMLRVYAAVGVVWFFWLIAVIPLMLCGAVHGMFSK